MSTLDADLLSIIDEQIDCSEVFRRIEHATNLLGFEHCAYGCRSAWPIAGSRTFIISNYSSEWMDRYQASSYVNLDPTVLHCATKGSPITWSDQVFREVPDFWGEAQSFGLRFGWAQSSLDGFGLGGMLTFARSHERISVKELDQKAAKMKWLVAIAHTAFKRVRLQATATSSVRLTVREVEVLKWTAEGKTSCEVADILLLSVDTINFHVKNAVSKLGVANKTAAAVSAAMLGLLT